MTGPQRQQGPRYHHGDLRAALVDAAVVVIGERGLRGFSLAEASRRLGVSSAAPYRHFAGRDDLLAAHGDATEPARRLAAMARAYVRFAAEQRPLFEALFSAGIDKTRYPGLPRAFGAADSFPGIVTEVCGGDAEAAGTLATALEAAAHGHATLLLDGEPGPDPATVAAAADRAAATTLAIIAGRAALS